MPRTARKMVSFMADEDVLIMLNMVQNKTRHINEAVRGYGDQDTVALRKRIELLEARVKTIELTLLD